MQIYFWFKLWIATNRTFKDNMHHDSKIESCNGANLYDKDKLTKFESCAQLLGNL
ncbi:hypothetical protein [Helicobacter sp. UBA3407]|uniref:hypothetical protein n=1 Tax=Helicobacter sp. UBA3407 TaxID=1946588 RepID=UPI002633C4C8|nr:hypothetical protein [Helicobacter sp. UBA3407]